MSCGAGADIDLEWREAVEQLDAQEREDLQWRFTKTEGTPRPTGGLSTPAFHELSDAARRAWLTHVENRRRALAEIGAAHGGR